MANAARKRKWIIATAGLVVCSVAALAFWLWSGFGYITTDDARVKANIVAISSETPGRIEKMLKDEGDQVEPDEVMVELDKREILIQIEQMQATADRVQSQVLQVEREPALVGVGRQIGDVESDQEGLDTMRTLGQNMGWLLKKTCD